MLRRRRRDSILRRRSDGAWDVDLPEDDRRFLAGLAEQLAALLSADPDDPSLRRLFPNAYEDDVAREAEYQMYMGDDLREARLAALDRLRETSERQRLTDEEVTQWMQAVNSLRLVLGTRLDVTEDDDPNNIDPRDPRAQTLVAYHYLGALLDRIVAALSGAP